MAHRPSRRRPIPPVLAGIRPGSVAVCAEWPDDISRTSDWRPAPTPAAAPAIADHGVIRGLNYVVAFSHKISFPVDADTFSAVQNGRHDEYQSESKGCRTRSRSRRHASEPRIGGTSSRRGAVWNRGVCFGGRLHGITDHDVSPGHPTRLLKPNWPLKPHWLGSPVKQRR